MDALADVGAVDVVGEGAEGAGEWAAASSTPAAEGAVEGRNLRLGEEDGSYSSNSTLQDLDIRDGVGRDEDTVEPHRHHHSICAISAVLETVGPCVTTQHSPRRSCILGSVVARSFATGALACPAFPHSTEKPRSTARLHPQTERPPPPPPPSRWATNIIPIDPSSPRPRTPSLDNSHSDTGLRETFLELEAIVVGCRRMRGERANLLAPQLDRVHPSCPRR